MEVSSVAGVIRSDWVRGGLSEEETRVVCFKREWNGLEVAVRGFFEGEVFRRVCLGLRLGVAAGGSSTKDSSSLSSVMVASESCVMVGAEVWGTEQESILGCYLS